MKLYILASFLFLTLIEGRNDGWERNKKLLQQGRSQVDQQLQGKEHDCALRMIDAIPTATSLGDVFTTLDSCNLDADGIVSMSGKLQEIYSRIYGVPIQNTQPLSDEEVSRITGITQEEIEADKIAAAQNSENQSL